MNFDAIHELALQYAHGDITAEDYFAACDEYARELVAAEMAHLSLRPRRNRAHARHKRTEGGGR